MPPSEKKKLINNNEFQKVENELKKINSIKDIEVYRKNNIELGFKISDREPIAYILNSNSFLDNSSILIDRVDKVIDSLPKIYGSLETWKDVKVCPVSTIAITITKKAIISYFSSSC